MRASPRWRRGRGSAAGPARSERRATGAHGPNGAGRSAARPRAGPRPFPPGSPAPGSPARLASAALGASASIFARCASMSPWSVGKLPTGGGGPDRIGASTTSQSEKSARRVRPTAPPTGWSWRRPPSPRSPPPRPVGGGKRADLVVRDTQRVEPGGQRHGRICPISACTSRPSASGAAISTISQPALCSMPATPWAAPASPRRNVRREHQPDARRSGRDRLGPRHARRLEAAATSLSDRASTPSEAIPIR
jgi:hypothetical protein